MRDRDRWGGVAAVLLVVKGAAILAWGADPSLVPPATFLLALAMLALRARLGGRGAWLAALGGVLAWVTLAASTVNLSGLALGATPPGEPGAPALLEVTYMLAFLGILVGLAALGIAVWRARAMTGPLNAVPLAVGLAWFPLQGAGFEISDGIGLVLGGLAWALLGLALVASAEPPTTRPRRAR